MIAFRVLLMLMTAGLLGFTGIVGSNHGWNLFPVFFGDMLAMTWAGQFNLDFTCFLVLSGLWLAWRHHFSKGGLLLGLAGLTLGILLLAPYLLYLSFEAKGDVKKMLLGKTRVGR